jgi:RNA polymerase sigma-70 factor (ECF subfamily)
VVQKNENKEEDQLLVEKVLRGDTGSFAVIIKKTERLVAQIIFKMITFPEDRKDLAQEVYLKVYKNLKGFQFQSRLTTWIAQITYNACINHLRKKKLVLVDDGAMMESENEVIETLQNKWHAGRNDSEAFLFNKELAQILQAEIEKLPPIYKTLITLFHNEELSYIEIVEITGLSEGTLKSYLFRARKKLRENILLHYKKEAL